MPDAAQTPVVVLTTAGSETQAREIARALVERSVAACVSVLGPACSVYRWQGRIVEEEERLLVIKTTVERLEVLRAAIREVHSYEVPEFVALEVASADPAYLAWLVDAVAAQ